MDALRNTRPSLRLPSGAPAGGLRAEERGLSFIPISYNINKLWLVKILMKNGKLPRF